MTINVTPIPRLIDLAAPAFTLGTANTAGSATTAVASDATLLAFDTTLPAATGTAAVGTATTAPRRDHVHAGTGLAAPALTLGTANSAGSASTALATDSTLLAFDTTVPTTIAYSASAAAGSAVVTSRRDHTHGMVAAPDAVATQAEMEAETADRLVTAELMHFGPSAAKVWCRADAAGNITTSYNMTSVTDDATGVITFNYATDFSSADHIAIPGVAHATLLVATQTGRTAGTTSYTARVASGTATDPGAWSLIAMGDQA
jgi:hypothetical protein